MLSNFYASKHPLGLRNSFYIRKHHETDPVRFKKVSERLQQILDDFGQQWDQIIEQMQPLIDELRSQSPPADEAELDIPQIYAPFLRTVLAACSVNDETSEEQISIIRQMTMEIVDRIIEEIRANRSIWDRFKMADQENLRSELFVIIVDKQLNGFSVTDAERLANQLLQQAKANDKMLRNA